MAYRTLVALGAEDSVGAADVAVVEMVPSAAIALRLFRRESVPSPATPSPESPFFFWKAISARLVLTPNFPSAVPVM